MPGPLSQVLLQLGYVVLERKSGGTFVLLSDAPDWFLELFPGKVSGVRDLLLSEVLPFLDNFLTDAEAFWDAGRPGVCESGTWIEKTNSGKDVPLEAKAVQSCGKQLLTLHSPDPEYAEQVRILQTARNSLLEHEKLLGEIQKKEILLHCIVHDLSQPLSAMRGTFDCLAMESEPERMAKFIELGKHASEQQETMIREILKSFAADLEATLDAEKSANSSPDLLVAAKSATSTLSAAFEAKGVRLSLKDDVATTRNWFVQGEETRLCRVFSNLLENALRYTPNGSSVTIGIEDDGGFFKAYVDDEGPGLPEELRPAQIFALFGKGKESGGKAGLGLYFCRITVERWGGSIGCASLPEKGSRFWFRLPRAVKADETIPQGRTTKSMEDSKQGKTEKRQALQILLADDQEDIRTLTSHQLQRNGHLVVTVANGKEALETAQQEHYDVILLDEEMPMMSGVQVARAIREIQKQQENRSILVALTGNNTPDDRERLIAAGFDSVLGKPFRLESLEAFLRDPGRFGSLELLGKKRSVKESASLEDLLQRVGGDQKLLQQMIRTFLRETPKRMGTIQKALEHKDGEELSARAHALKGSVSIFGGARAAQHTQSLQELGRIPEFTEASRVFASLQEEIAKLQENLRGYAKQSLAEASTVAKQKFKKPSKPQARKR
jgi:signal transduction histidine kinase/HPt (histidine-containing phosphotransfer) domain-containing protein/ActR/RegA family two-component response regulator